MSFFSGRLTRLIHNEIVFYFQEIIRYRRGVCVLGVLIRNRFQDETKSRVFWASGFVAHSLSRLVGTNMRLARAWPDAQNSARLNLILKAHWNKQLVEAQP